MPLGTSTPDSQSKRWQNLRLAAVGVSVGAAITLGLLIWVSASSRSIQQRDNIHCYFLRSAYRVGDVFRLPSKVSVSTEMLRRELWSPWLRLSLELTLLLTLILAAVIVYVVLKLTARGRQENWLTPITWFAVPFGYALATTATKNWDHRYFEPGLPQPLLSIPGWVLLAELAIFLFLSARHITPTSRVWRTLLFLIHFCFWDYVLLDQYPVIGNVLTMQYLIVVSAPVAALAAICSDRSLSHGAPTPRARTTLGNAIAAIMAAFALCAIWGPLPQRALNLSKDSHEFTVRLSRGRCFGSCPSYTVTVNPDGAVKYVGQRRDGADDVQYGKITADQYAAILVVLHDAKFESLDDRAFLWAFDTPSVGVAVESPRVNKTVVSDSGYFGPDGGPQAKFVVAAASVEKIVDPSHWVEATTQARYRQ